MQHLITFAALTCTVALATAQNTWIVDNHNGLGTNFQDLPAAVATAASGDRLIVRG